MPHNPTMKREARLAEQIVDMILDGDPVWLEADQREFLGIYTEADESRAAVLILHGTWLSSGLGRRHQSVTRWSG